MKHKSVHLLSLTIMANLIFSCSTKRSPDIDFIGENTDFKIRCYGTKSVEFDPWMLSVSPIYKDSIYPGVEMEVRVGEPSKDNISIQWLGPQRAVITVKETDGSLKTLPVTVEF